MDRVSQREWVVKALYQIEFNKSRLDEVDSILQTHEIDSIEFIKESVISTIENLDVIDEIIKKHLDKRPFEKLTVLDKSILRTAINEFVVQKSVPTSVSINEAIEISKKYSDQDSYKLINGVLSAVAKEI